MNCQSGTSTPGGREVYRCGMQMNRQSGTNTTCGQTEVCCCGLQMNRPGGTSTPGGFIIQALPTVPCNLCPNLMICFEFVEDLVVHQIDCHRGIVEKDHVCKRCSRYFRKVKDLCEHDKKSRLK